MKEQGDGVYRLLVLIQDRFVTLLWIYLFGFTRGTRRSAWLIVFVEYVSKSPDIEFLHREHFLHDTLAAFVVGE